MPNIPYMKLTDQTYVLQLPDRPVYLTPYTYNYQRIIRSLDTITLLELEQYLVPPTYPNGPYLLYISGPSLFYTNNATTTYIGAKPTTESTIFLGTYTSVDEICDLFPEYFI